jgi:hypothetical protein
MLPMFFVRGRWGWDGVGVGSICGNAENSVVVVKGVE